MSVIITAQEITRANNPQPLGQLESGTVRKFIPFPTTTSAGKFTVKVKNVDASAALNAAIKIHYTIL